MLGEYKRILAAVDGSDEADQAFKRAVSLAGLSQGELLIVNIVELVRDSKTLSSKGLDEEKEKAEKMLAEYKTYAAEQGVDSVRIMIKTGSPKRILTEVLPKEELIDLIVVGASGLGAWERFVIGSVSSNVVHYAPTDVLLTRSQG